MWIVKIADHYAVGDLYLNTYPVKECPICGQPGVNIAGRYLHSFSILDRQSGRTPVDFCGPDMIAQPINLQPLGELSYA